MNNTSKEHATEARVVKFGCLAPTQGATIVRAQMRAAQRYYNALIALERCRRAVYRDIRGECADFAVIEETVSSLRTELAELRTAIKSERKDARRRVVTKALNDRAKETHERLQLAKSALKDARAKVRDDERLRERVADLDARCKVWAKGLRATTEAYWGTYLLVEASVDQARKATVDPGFRRARGFERTTPVEGWCGEGRIGVQIQGGISIDELYAGQDTRVRLEAVPEDAWHSSSRSVRRKLARSRLWVRVGSEGRSPIWAVFPVLVHRPIPSDARVKGVAVRVEVIGTTERWTASITYTREATPLPQRGGTVALDLGWRKRPDASLRVAYWTDADGRHGEYTMPAAIRERLKHARDLQSIQDTHYNRIQVRLVKWFEHAKSETVRLPAYLADVSRYLAQWRSHERLRRLVLEHWRHQRFAGDEGIYPEIEAWAHQSRHLSQWQRHEHARALGYRREVYRRCAAQLARTYGTVIVEKFDLHQAKRLQAPERDPDSPQPARAQLHASAPGELRHAIQQTVAREGGLVIALGAAGTTTTCHECGCECRWDQAADLRHTCEHCGASWDQDHNAAINLLRAFGRERSGDAQTPAPARSPAKPAKRRRVSPSQLDAPPPSE